MTLDLPTFKSDQPTFKFSEICNLIIAGTIDVGDIVGLKNDLYYLTVPIDDEPRPKRQRTVETPAIHESKCLQHLLTPMNLETFMQHFPNVSAQLIQQTWQAWTDSELFKTMVTQRRGYIQSCLCETKCEDVKYDRCGVDGCPFTVGNICQYMPLVCGYHSPLTGSLDEMQAKLVRSVAETNLDFLPITMQCDPDRCHFSHFDRTTRLAFKRRHTRQEYARDFARIVKDLLGCDTLLELCLQFPQFENKFDEVEVYLAIVRRSVIHRVLSPYVPEPGIIAKICDYLLPTVPLDSLRRTRDTTYDGTIDVHLAAPTFFSPQCGHDHTCMLRWGISTIPNNGFLDHYYGPEEDHICAFAPIGELAGHLQWDDESDSGFGSDWIALWLEEAISIVGSNCEVRLGLQDHTWLGAEPVDDKDHGVKFVDVVTAHEFDALSRRLLYIKWRSYSTELEWEGWRGVEPEPTTQRLVYLNIDTLIVRVVVECENIHEEVEAEEEDEWEDYVFAILCDQCQSRRALMKKLDPKVWYQVDGDDAQIRRTLKRACGW